MILNILALPLKRLLQHIKSSRPNASSGGLPNTTVDRKKSTVNTAGFVAEQVHNGVFHFVHLCHKKVIFTAKIPAKILNATVLVEIQLLSQCSTLVRRPKLTH